jgi:integrase/recombinase XerD
MSPKLPENLPEVLSFEEIKLILNSIKANKETNIRNKAMMELLYAAGLRISELINLKFSNINIEECFLKIIGKGLKERLVPFSPRAKKFLNKYLKIRKQIRNENENVFVSRLRKKISRSEFWRQFKNIIKNTNIEKKITPHTFRHSFATHLLMGGADIRFVQEILGHISISTTQIYTHISKQQILQKYKKFHPRS